MDHGEGGLGKLLKTGDGADKAISEEPGGPSNSL